MNYFVSIGDSYYHIWQINILINSFKKANLIDKLFICLSTDLNIKNNFLDCKNVYHFKNEGLVKDYLKYNKWFCLYQLLEKKIISLPVTVLEPHTLLIKDTREIKGDIIYNINDEFCYNEKYLFNSYLDDQNIKDNWIRLSDNIIFNQNIDIKLFYDILENMELYSMYFEDYKNLDKYCLMRSIWNYKIKNLVGLNNLESYLPQNQLNYILDYRHGFKDKFNKLFFKQNDIVFSSENIKEIISKNRVSECLNFFYNTI